MDAIRQTILGMRQAQAERIQKGITLSGGAESEEVRKGEDVEDPDRFLKATEESEEDIEKNEQEEQEEQTEKSDIASALSGYGSKIIVKKTGKEIKDQIANVILPDLTARLATKEAELTTILESCGNAPTHDVPCWWTDDIKMDVGYKSYNWRETEWCDRDNRFNMPTYSAQDAQEKKENLAESKEQSIARSKYNDCLRDICNIKVDIKTCEVMSNNLKDTEKFELTSRQIMTLRF